MGTNNMEDVIHNMEDVIHNMEVLIPNMEGVVTSLWKLLTRVSKISFITWLIRCLAMLVLELGLLGECPRDHQEANKTGILKVILKTQLKDQEINVPVQTIEQRDREDLIINTGVQQSCSFSIFGN